ncbi:MAG: glycosyltransferase family 2 protein [Candidatus Magasanikbacteria bacterium]|nr:glycosyltransferase family 2 protein [Candidatus Magasanikbacteria bacterium]
MKKIAIIYLSFHCEPYIDDVVAAMETVDYPKEDLEFIVVDNPHPQHGLSMPYLEQHVLPKSGLSLPKVTLLPQTENLGFAGGNNVGVRYAIEQNFDYVFFLNNDAYPTQNTFKGLVAAFETDSKIAIAQSLIMLHPERQLINTSGNMIQFCGFGYCRDYRVPLAQRSFRAIEDVPYASGAAFMIPTILCKEFGAWDNDFFLYHEDMEWSLRVKSMGYRVVMVRDSMVYHAYEFARSITKFYWMERNRFGVLLMYLKLPTLVLITPAVVAYELGTYLFALKGGWASEKYKLYDYWRRPENWKMWLGKREKIQKQRSVSDAELTRDWVGYIKFQEARVENPLLSRVVNPVMSAYWWLVKKVLFW